LKGLTDRVNRAVTPVEIHLAIGIFGELEILVFTELDGLLFVVKI
jgi:hypothetical protein